MTNSACLVGQDGICTPNGQELCRLGYGGSGCQPVICHDFCLSGQCNGILSTDCNKIYFIFKIFSFIFYYKNRF